MGKPTGFMEHPRQAPVRRPAAERVRDWAELYTPRPEKNLKQEGSRCMDCGVPFCHTGSDDGGKTTGCPLHNLIPEWNDLVYRGRWREALERLHKTNNFPEWTGRICPAPCESACVLGITDPPVAIKGIENAIVDRGFAEGWIVPRPPAHRTGKKVAVIGSGPAGLAAAAQLNYAGHHVTVFERDDRLGGLLMYGVPNMKLDKKNVQRRVDLLAAEGVEFRTNAHVGVNIDAAHLRREHDAILVAVGALKGQDLRIPGRQLGGVHLAMEFLHKNTKSLLDSGLKDGQFINAKDRHVVVIGAGDTGTDCIGTALRHGCRSLVNFARRPQPSKTREPHNPWPQEAEVLLTDYGHEEGAALFGSDPRKYNLVTKEFVDDGKGRVKAVRTVRVEWERLGNGDYANPREIEGSQYDWPAELVLLAIGFTGPEPTVVEKLGLATDPKSNIRAEFGRFATNVEGVYVAGDARRGASLIVWAITEGRQAAREIDRYLMGVTSLP